MNPAAVWNAVTQRGGGLRTAQVCVNTTERTREGDADPMTRLTTTTATPLAVSADYADALLVARRAKKLLFLLLMLGLLAQIAIFLCAKFNVLKISADDNVTVTTPKKVETSTSSSSPSAAATEPTTQETTTST